MSLAEPLHTPILFLIFNRPDLTKLVFNEIREVKPKYLFIAADGPRKDHPNDIEKCKEARAEVFDKIDWNCEVKTLFRDDNLGCGKAISEAINWFFEFVEEGIILEDDCYPDKSFYEFCSNSLKHYRNEDKVMHISGSNFQLGKRWGLGESYFSKYSHIWGWATWRNSWSLYKKTFRDLDVAMDKIAENYELSTEEKKFWFNNIDQSFRGIIDTWDYQWQFSIWFEQGVCLHPNFNLVRNLGFDNPTTHSFNNTRFKELKIEEGIDLRTFSQDIFEINKEADHFTFENFYNPKVTKDLSYFRTLLKKVFS